MPGLRRDSDERQRELRGPAAVDRLAPELKSLCMDRREKAENARAEFDFMPYEAERTPLTEARDLHVGIAKPRSGVKPNPRWQTLVLQGSGGTREGAPSSQ